MIRIIALGCIVLLLLAGCDEGGNHASVQTRIYDEVSENVYNPEMESGTVEIPDYSENDNTLNSGEDIETNLNDGKLSEDKKLTEEEIIRQLIELGAVVESGEIEVKEKVEVSEGTESEKKNEDKKETEVAKETEIKEETEDKKPEKDYTEVILRNFESKVPEEVVLNIKYDKYQILTDYLLIMSDGANIREKPSTSAKVIGKVRYFDKIRLISEVQGEFLEKYKTDKWYKVVFNADNKTLEGYIFSNLAQPRSFQFDKMYEAVKRAEREIETNTIAYISNYKNSTGTAPLYNGNTKDKFGIQRYQAAPAYYQPNLNSEFRYISDGTVVSVLEETESFYKIRTLSFEGEYYVPKKYVSFNKSIEKLTKAIVVDRKNQNEGVFELIDGKWNLISYTYATTGENARYKLPTDLGYFMAIEKVSRFLYLSDTTKQIAGYAPYGIRFNGGAYIHGVPVDYVFKDGKRIDPGMQEYSSTIGTVPKSHKCVRNYTSHAKFLYDWVDIGKSMVIVIE
ncbi:SH3 domain-containing protein [Acetivibrio clariflavus]|uniref:L,D-transpeptidase family protein n=1 Tax=Acetivibrio clariflavus TaxID=288965 RepID=UPI0031F53320